METEQDVMVKKTKNLKRRRYRRRQRQQLKRVFVGPFSHRLMGFQLPQLVEQPIPTPVAKSEVRVHIKVDVDTKGKHLANNGPILIVDRRPQQHRLLLFGVDDQDDSDDSFRWQSYDE
ncbi:unnamed protein product [Rotaria magnacalcarata]|uniref:Uncharacterized protein n=2 Tax=Rotaria magnacalcarata TaxID=392030 RepID=A0A819YEA9_9BILA|nr:unnamed protein product [Rotaria magnacalcarata]CAF4153679.1 unnamed protein product [Rotaria magnacalcarata]